MEQNYVTVILCTDAWASSKYGSRSNEMQDKSFLTVFNEQDNVSTVHVTKC